MVLMGIPTSAPCAPLPLRFSLDGGIKQWKAIGAVPPFEFELRTLEQGNSESVYNHSISTDNSEIPLPTGYFSLRWRSLQGSRRSTWSPGQVVFIAMSAPEVDVPASLKTDNGAFSISWKSVEGASHYLVNLHKLSELKSPDQVAVASGNSFTFAKITPGKYYYSVAALSPKKGFTDKTATLPIHFQQGDWSRSVYFTALETDSRKLTAILVSPRGKILENKSVITFNWTVKQPMNSYEFRLFRVDADGQQTLIADVNNLRDPFVFCPLGILPHGSYRWQITGFTDTAAAPAQSGYQNFQIVETFKHDIERVMIVGGFQFARYSWTASTNDFRNDFDAAMSGPYVEAQYYLKPNVGLHLSLSQTSFTFQSESQTLSKLKFDGFYEWNLNPRWKLDLGVGIEKKSTPEIIATDNAYPTPDYKLANSNRLILMPHLELKYQFDDFTQTFVNAQVGKALQFTSGVEAGGVLSKPSLPLRLTAGLRGRWLRPWGITFEASNDQDSYQYKTSSNEIRISFQGFQFLVGVFYIF